MLTLVNSVFWIVNFSCKANLDMFSITEIFGSKVIGSFQLELMFSTFAWRQLHLKLLHEEKFRGRCKEIS